MIRWAMNMLPGGLTAYRNVQILHDGIDADPAMQKVLRARRASDRQRHRGSRSRVPSHTLRQWRRLVHLRRCFLQFPAWEQSAAAPGRQRGCPGLAREAARSKCQEPQCQQEADDHGSDEPGRCGTAGAGRPRGQQPRHRRHVAADGLEGCTRRLTRTPGQPVPVPAVEEAQPLRLVTVLRARETFISRLLERHLRLSRIAPRPILCLTRTLTTPGEITQAGVEGCRPDVRKTRSAALSVLRCHAYDADGNRLLRGDDVGQHEGLIMRCLKHAHIEADLAELLSRFA